MNALALPPWERWSVRLECVRPARLPLLHGAEVRALLCWALGQASLPAGLIFYAPESARLGYQPGERYLVGLTLVGEVRGRLEELLGSLRANLPAPPAPDGSPPLLASCFRFSRAWPLPAPDLAHEVRTLAQYPAVELRFLSPLRLPIPRRLRHQRQRWLGETCCPAQPLLAEMRRRVAAFTGWTHELADPGPAAGAPVASPRPFVRLSLTIPAGAGTRRIEGVQGRLVLHGVPSRILPALVAARYLQIGQAIPFGFGRFDLPDLAPFAPEPWRPACSLRSRLGSAGLLAAAADRVLGSERAASGSATLVEGLARAVARGDLNPGPLRPRTLRRPGKPDRRLAVPPVADRILQRAAHALLAPLFEQLFASASFGYRHGRSRFDAAGSVLTGWAAGERVVVDADIESFFDAVPWPRLLARLEALLPREPLVDLVASWITSPLAAGATQVARRQGLPQGSPLSPLLANFVLDELDRVLLARGARLVRYADDFALLCRDRAEADRRLQEAQAVLAGLGFRLHPEKTVIRAMADGWTFLGFLFCGPMAFDRARAAAGPVALRGGER
jgi:group II intron reverse transcriptase/maturase